MLDYPNYTAVLSPRYIPENEIFKFNTSHRLFIVYQGYFEFCVENLNNSWDGFLVQPCIFYFRKDSDPNAGAGCFPDGFKIIEVNNSLIDKLFGRFEQAQPYLESLPENALINTVTNDPLYFLMFQTTTMFLYYHEFGHILQFSGKRRMNYNEKNVVKVGANFDFMDHVVEMDSDEFAANYVIHQVFFYFEKLDAKSQSKEGLVALISTSLASIFLLFEALSGKIDLPIVYQSGDHPNDIIRISAITGLFIDKVKSTYGDLFDLDMSSLIRRAFEIVMPLLSSDYSLEKFFEVLKSDKRKLVKYSVYAMKERDKHKWMAGSQLRSKD